MPVLYDRDYYFVTINVFLLASMAKISILRHKGLMGCVFLACLSELNWLILQIIETSPWMNCINMHGFMLFLLHTSPGLVINALCLRILIFGFIMILCICITLETLTD